MRVAEPAHELFCRRILQTDNFVDERIVAPLERRDFLDAAEQVDIEFARTEMPMW
jgi:hypothetical protein